MDTDVVVLARFLLTGVALVLAFLAVVTWNRRKDAREAGTFALLVGAMAIYAFGYSGEIVQTTVAGATRWLDFEYLVLPWTPALWLLAACRHNGIRVRAPLIFVIPAIVFVGHLTNFHRLFYSAPLTIAQRGPFWVLQMPRGPISVLDDAFLVVAFLTGAWLYLAGLRHASSLFRKQAFILLLSSLLPFVGNMMYLAGLTPWGLDITPITLSVTCVFVYYGIFHCGIFDLAPLARNLIFNSIRDAVLILDTQDRLIDFNPAARALLPVLDKGSLGGDVEELFAGTVGLATVLSKTGDAIEFSMGQDPDSPSYQIRTWPLASASGQLGRAVIFADITAQVRLREELRRRAETDPLTDVANRRRFQHALEVECMRYTRGHAPLSVLMIDLDFFKDVNDQFGHPIGDQVLRGVAQTLLACLRKTDLLARYGGEEFAVLLPETRCEGAQVIADRLRLAVCKKPIEAEGNQVPLTVSVGVASHANDNEVDPQILLKKADLALYRAKASGRNRIEVA